MVNLNGIQTIIQVQVFKFVAIELYMIFSHYAFWPYFLCNLVGNSWILMASTNKPHISMALHNEDHFAFAAQVNECWKGVGDEWDLLHSTIQLPRFFLSGVSIVLQGFAGLHCLWLADKGKQREWWITQGFYEPGLEVVLKPTFHYPELSHVATSSSKASFVKVLPRRIIMFGEHLAASKTFSPQVENSTDLGSWGRKHSRAQGPYWSGNKDEVPKWVWKTGAFCCKLSPLEGWGGGLPFRGA